MVYFSLVTLFKSILSDVYIAPPAILWLFKVFYLFTFNLFISLSLKYISCKTILRLFNPIWQCLPFEWIYWNSFIEINLIHLYLVLFLRWLSLHLLFFILFSVYVMSVLLPYSFFIVSFCTEWMLNELSGYLIPFYFISYLSFLCSCSMAYNIP